MKIKKILTLFFVTAISISTVACSVSAPADNDEYEEISSSSCSPVSSSSSIKKISSSSTAQSSSSVKISSSSFTEKSSSSKATSSSSQAKSSSSEKSKTILEAVQESGKYTTRDSVAAYLCKFDKLPSNYVSKDEGQKLYESKTGKTFEKWNFNPWTTIGVMIGGDKFNNYASNASNYHATLPEGSYHEADVDYSAKNRGTKRLVYQNDCVIYYTADHYETFSKLEIQ